MTESPQSQHPELRVALIIPSLDQGGAEKQLCLLACGLPQYGVEPHVIVLTRDGPLRAGLEDAGIAVDVIGKRFRADPTAYFRLRNLLKRTAPTVVHTWLFAANAYGRRAALSVGVPVVLGSERCVDLWKSPFHFAIDRYLARRGAGITTNSRGVRDFYQAHGIAEDRFVIIPNGIPPRQVAEVSRRSLSSPRGRSGAQVDPGGRQTVAAKALP